MMNLGIIDVNFVIATDLRREYAVLLHAYNRLL